MLARLISRIVRTAAFVCLALPALGSVPAGWVQISASNIMDGGVLVANATISFAPVSSYGHAISFRIGSSSQGQAGPDPFTATITNGAFTILVPDTSLAYPTNPCYSVTITDNASGDMLSGPNYNCVQPSGIGQAATGTNAWCAPGTGSAGGTCNFDAYPPTIPNLPTTTSVAVGSGPFIGLYVNGTLVGSIAASIFTVNGSTVGTAQARTLTINGGVL